MAETKKKQAAVSLKKKKEGSIPTKTTMNLAFHESSFKITRIIPVLAVLIIAAGALTYLTLQQIDKQTLALNELSTKQSQLSLVNAQLSDYDELFDKYGRYSYGWMTESEASLVDRREVLNTIEKYLSSSASLENFSLSGNTITANICGVTLDEARDIVDKLQKDSLVSKATIYSATANDETMLAEVFITIVMAKEAQA